MMLLFLQAAAPAGTIDTVVMFWCALFTAGVFFYIFYPSREVASGGDKTRVAFLSERKDQVYENLRDLNFDYKAGKYPEADYAQMRASLEDEAAAMLAEIDRLENPPRFKSSPKGAR
jgi:hypothetical protein